MDLHISPRQDRLEVELGAMPKDWHMRCTSSGATVHGVEMEEIDGVMFSVKSEYDKDGNLARKILTRAE